MKTLKFADTDNDLRRIVDQIVLNTDVIAIERDDGPAVVVLSLAEYQSLMESAFLLGSPENAAHLARSLEQYRLGDVQVRELIEVDDSDAQPPIHSRSVG